MKTVVRTAVANGARKVLREKKPVPFGRDVLIHIGKCGGTTVRSAIDNSSKKNNIHVVHLRPPSVRKDLNYYIVARGPISRALSAFNWRYKLVVDEKTQRHRFAGEYDVLKKYGTLNKLAETLYDDRGNARKRAVEDLRKIHHLREDIAFYLEDFLKKVRPGQIKDVLMQETLADDIERVFGQKCDIVGRRGPKARAGDLLSGKARRNLRRYYARDFACLMRLYCLNKIRPDTFVRTL